MKKKIIITVSVLAILVCGWRVFSSDTFRNQPPRNPNPPFMNIETGYKFHVKLTEDFAGWPVKCPDTGKLTGYPVEICYWNKCRQSGGTWVVLNSTIGKEGATYCPVCGKRVVPHNPVPADILAYFAHGEDYPREAPASVPTATDENVKEN